jgi:hypothetical protein
LPSGLRIDLRLVVVENRRCNALASPLRLCVARRQQSVQREQLLSTAKVSPGHSAAILADGKTARGTVLSVREGCAELTTRMAQTLKRRARMLVAIFATLNHKHANLDFIRLVGPFQKATPATTKSRGMVRILSERKRAGHPMMSAIIAALTARTFAPAHLRLRRRHRYAATLQRKPNSRGL